MNEEFSSLESYRRNNAINIEVIKMNEKKVNNFNMGEYKTLLKKFRRCRKGMEGNLIYKQLRIIKPGAPFLDEVKYTLKKHCNTNPSGTYGKCAKPAQKIFDLLFG